MSVLGFICGPILTSLSTFKEVHFSFSLFGREFMVDERTYPGYISALFGLICLILYIFVFSEVKRKKTETREEEHHELTELDKVSELPSLEALKVPIIGVAVLNFCNFSFTVHFTVFETVGTPYSMIAYSWETLHTSIMWGALGIIAMIVVLLLQLSKWDERRVLIAAEIFMIVGSGILVDFYSLVSLPRFITGITCATIGFGVTEVLLLSIYSKLLEKFQQGAYMGYITASGSLARIVAPILAAYVFEYAQSGIVFIVPLMLTGVALALTIGFYKKNNVSLGNIFCL